MLARLATPSDLTVRRQRWVGLLLVLLVTGSAVLFWPSGAVQASPNKCDYKEWSQPGNIQHCIDQLDAPTTALQDCMGVPTPDAPDSGFGGWFADNPHVRGVTGMYSKYGYSGYSYTNYNPDCATGLSTSLTSSSMATTTIANGELTVATGIIGATNAIRERAYDPETMWGWSNNLVKTATKAVYEKVFSVFGVISIAIVGIYLIWRSRQANMSDALTTAGWAIMVMVVVTAVASWPLISAHLADNTLIAALGVVHSAVGPQPDNIPLAQCENAKQNPPPGVKHDPSLCTDHRSTAVRASDTATQAVLYDNWLRGELGSSTSRTAKKYGLALYQSSSLTWDEAETIKKHPNKQSAIYARKADDFRRIANQIKTEDPAAYKYLEGEQGSARIGAGLIAIVSALAFSFFDIAASILVIMGFLIFRWAVVAIPILGTVAILRPASAGFKRVINMVVAAIFNIVIFGAGGAIFLFAVDTIMNTTSLPGWLQIVLIWLCGVVGWLMLRPYRRITQLGGKNPVAEVTNIGSWHQRFFSDLKTIALSAGTAAVISDTKDENQGKKAKRQADSADREAPVMAGQTAAEQQTVTTTDAPTSPAPTGEPDPRESEPVPAGYRESARDDGIWDPATDRNMGANAYDDLVDMVNESEARLSSSADAVDSELAADREWSRH